MSHCPYTGEDTRSCECGGCDEPDERKAGEQRGKAAPVRIEIDLNVRVRGRQTYAGFEDVAGQRSFAATRAGNASAPVAIGDKVLAFESEEGIVTDAEVVDIDYEKQFIYLAVDWHGFRDDEQQERKPEADEAV